MKELPVAPGTVAPSTSQLVERLPPVGFSRPTEKVLLPGNGIDTKPGAGFSEPGSMGSMPEAGTPNPPWYRSRTKDCAQIGQKGWPSAFIRQFCRGR